MIRRIVLALAFAAGAVLPAAAQTAAATGPSFLPRYTFHLNAEHLSSDDPRFVWDADFGGEIDIVDYGAGRATFVANYEVIMGTQLRRFDPNQGNYILEGSASARVAGLELAAVFYHQSRHLSDRTKRLPVDWNMLGGRAAGTWNAGPTHLDARVDLRGTLKKSYVDYEWEMDARVRDDLVLHPRVGLLVAGQLRMLGTDGSRDRGTQTGFRGEGGVRLQGDAGAVELFVAGERRVDPYQLEFGTDTWFLAGFRIVSR